MSALAQLVTLLWSMASNEVVAEWRASVGRPFMDRLWREGRAWIIDRTVALFKRTKTGDPVAHGTGVLLRIADARFLISASHVLSVIDDPDMRLFVSSAGVEHDGHLFEITDTRFHGTNDQRVEDLGFCVLPATVAEALSATKQFLSLSELDSVDDEPSDELYAVVGYPLQTMRREGTTVHSEVFFLMTPLYGGTLDNYEKGVSLAVAYPRNHIVDATGDHARPPHLGGISGCGMWRLCKFDANAPATWSSSSIRLVGVEHSWHEHHAIRGSMIRHVIDRIGEVRPDLASSIEITRGSTKRLVQPSPSQRIVGVRLV